MLASSVDQRKETQVTKLYGWGLTEDLERKMYLNGYSLGGEIIAIGEVGEPPRLNQHRKGTISSA